MFQMIAHTHTSNTICIVDTFKNATPPNPTMKVLPPVLEIDCHNKTKQF